MEKAPTFFIAVYTNEVKDYCDKKFFKRLFTIAKGNPVHVIDNSEKNHYYIRLQKLCGGYKNFTIHHLEEEREPLESLFHRRVTASVLLLRKIFLETNLPYFFIIESDVLAPRSILKKMNRAIMELDEQEKKWGILGALYHKGFHNYALKGLQQTNHVLSGCSIYKRSLIERFPFRWSEENMAAFPDAWICYDSCGEYNFYNDHRIDCKHMENKQTGTRYSREL